MAASQISVFGVDPVAYQPCETLNSTAMERVSKGLCAKWSHVILSDCNERSISVVYMKLLCALRFFGAARLRMTYKNNFADTLQ